MNYNIENYNPKMTGDNKHDTNNNDLQIIIQKLNEALINANERIKTLEKKVG